VYTNKDTPNFGDPVELDSCGYIWSEYQLRWDTLQYDDKNVFNDEMYLFHKLKYKFAWIMQLSEEDRDSMSFKEAYTIANLIKSQRFEGVTQMVGWVGEDEKDMNLTIKFGNVRPLTNATRNIFVTKVME